MYDDAISNEFKRFNVHFETYYEARNSLREYARNANSRRDSTTPEAYDTP